MNRATTAFVALGLIWGSNFIFMKWASETITAGQITLLRVLFGFLPVLVYATVRRALDRHHLRYAHHFLVMSLLATSVYYFAFAAGTSLLPSALADDTRATVGLVLGLGILGTGVAYILYYFIVDQLGAVTASSATYIPPVVALAIGWLLVDEPLDLWDAVAVLLILTGVVVLRSGPSRPGVTA